MSANDYYNAGKPGEPYPPQQGQYYPPPGPPPQGGYYPPPQEPQQAYQGGYYQPPPQGYPQPGYQPQPQPQTVIIQQQPEKESNVGCWACLAGICLCCCAEEICDCLF
ncbi:hypothetical protein AX16_001436 [Volvariella volvacea WC 439]|nr:hypothetical protein AX16_001436 [Volvariella volvacea WC 439]